MSIEDFSDEDYYEFRKMLDGTPIMKEMFNGGIVTLMMEAQNKEYQQIFTTATTLMFTFWLNGRAYRPQKTSENLFTKIYEGIERGITAVKVWLLIAYYWTMMRIEEYIVTPILEMIPGERIFT